ncbi:S-layer homology domain-containing protein [Paenibacillus sp. J5C_2022]|uniref:S-layer homology domain-containing protein n=1 Tax=Paenibacillus sp. J5C2022 TaxID=2977129 RepID=UPI0021D1055D|nr:S-layer homology domain-containing protein [Paenibacillus sp. J5C2022]MCU6711449.1 S-layer homology domain-containing protein [Paenibacillus sp. J5C2022]
MKMTKAVILSAALALGVSVGVASADGMTAQEKFDALKAKGIFSGLNDRGDSGLDQNMTRAQFARVAGLLDGLNVDATPSSTTFRDVSTDHWAYEEIAAASRAGLMQGNGNGTFNPDGHVTTEQMATVLTRLLRIQPDNSATVGGDVSDWAQKYVDAALRAGLISSDSDFQAPATRGQLVNSTYETDQLQGEVRTVKEENKPSIGKLLALGVMSADESRFGGMETMSKDDVLKALGTMTNDKLDLSKLTLSDNPSFAEILRAYLQALGYPADMLNDSDKLVEQAIEAGIVGEDSPLLKVQQLNVPMTREWGSYLTAGTLFNASTVTVDSEGNVKQNADKKLSQTMKLPKSPIKVELEDIEGVPTYTTLKSIDTSIADRLSNAGGGGGVYIPPVVTDTTAPSITAATINGQNVQLTNGETGTITLQYSYNDGYLDEGTISVNEASTLKITAIEGVNLSQFATNFLTQSLNAGVNNLDLISKLNTIVMDPQDDGISFSLVNEWDEDNNGLTITGELSDGSNNSRTVTLTIMVGEV